MLDNSLRGLLVINTDGTPLRNAGDSDELFELQYSAEEIFRKRSDDGRILYANHSGKQIDALFDENNKSLLTPANG